MFQHQAVNQIRHLLGSFSWGQGWQEVPGSEGLNFRHEASASEITVTDEGRIVVISDRYLTGPVAFDARAWASLDEEFIWLLHGLSEGNNARLLKVVGVDDIKFAVS